MSRRGKARVRQQMLRCDRHGVVLEDVTSAVLSATIDLDLERPVSPLRLRGEFRAAGVVAPYQDHLLPRLRLEYPDGTVIDEPLGLFAVAPSPRRHTYRSTRETFVAYDHTWRLATSSLTAPYSVPAGSNVVEAVRSVLAAHGFTAPEIAIDASPLKLTEAATWGIGESVTWLVVVNSLLGAIGYTGLHTTRAGQVRAFALPDLENAPVAKTYTAETGEVTATITEDPNTDLICNVVLVINDRDGGAPLVAIAENHDPASPVSIENLDRVLAREIRDANIPDQATAEAIALRALQEGATYDNRVTITTAPDPTRNPHEIYGFAIAQADATSVLAGRWRCTGWSLGLSVPDVVMTHQIGKIVPVGAGP